jgi:hypothetical protein
MINIGGHMKIILSLILAYTAFSPLAAVQKYNGFSNKWETVPQDSQLKYNGLENTWSYQPPDAQIEYNSFENQYQWNSGHNGY